MSGQMGAIKCENKYRVVAGRGGKSCSLRAFGPYAAFRNTIRVIAQPTALAEVQSRVSGNAAANHSSPSPDPSTSGAAGPLSNLFQRDT